MDWVQYCMYVILAGFGTGENEEAHDGQEFATCKCEGEAVARIFRGIYWFAVLY